MAKEENQVGKNLARNLDFIHALIWEPSAECPLMAYLEIEREYGDPKSFFSLKQRKDGNLTGAISYLFNREFQTPYKILERIWGKERTQLKTKKSLFQRYYEAMFYPKESEIHPGYVSVNRTLETLLPEESKKKPETLKNLLVRRVSEDLYASLREEKGIIYLPLKKNAQLFREVLRELKPEMSSSEIDPEDLDNVVKYYPEILETGKKAKLKRIGDNLNAASLVHDLLIAIRHPGRFILYKDEDMGAMALKEVLSRLPEVNGEVRRGQLVNEVFEWAKEECNLTYEEACKLAREIFPAPSLDIETLIILSGVSHINGEERFSERSIRSMNLSGFGEGPFDPVDENLYCTDCFA